jgi:hypothetical protein
MIAHRVFIVVVIDTLGAWFFHGAKYMEVTA